MKIAHHKIWKNYKSTSKAHATVTTESSSVAGHCFNHWQPSGQLCLVKVRNFACRASKVCLSMWGLLKAAAKTGFQHNDWMYGVNLSHSPIFWFDDYNQQAVMYFMGQHHLKILMLTTEKVLASKARRKVQSSYRMQPTAQTSDLELYFFPCMPRCWLLAGNLTSQCTLCVFSKGHAESLAP